jgi:leader peptidase (prepilin peptidase)/N-methyltransferase
MRVPNILSLPGAALAVGLSGVCGVHGWGQTLLGAVVGAGVLFAIHLLSRGSMGLGDVKLYLSIGAMLGPLYAMESLVMASLSGVMVGYGLRMSGLMKKREPMPFVPHIVIGVVVIAFFGHPLTEWYLHNLLATGV